jgi:hypothetical protein
VCFAIAEICWKYICHGWSIYCFCHRARFGDLDETTKGKPWQCTSIQLVLLVSCPSLENQNSFVFEHKKPSFHICIAMRNQDVMAKVQSYKKILPRISNVATGFYVI